MKTQALSWDFPSFHLCLILKPWSHSLNCQSSKCAALIWSYHSWASRSTLTLPAPHLLPNEKLSFGIRWIFVHNFSCAHVNWINKEQVNEATAKHTQFSWMCEHFVVWCVMCFVKQTAHKTCEWLMKHEFRSTYITIWQTVCHTIVKCWCARIHTVRLIDGGKCSPGYAAPYIFTNLHSTQLERKREIERKRDGAHLIANNWNECRRFW